ncbi:amidohydrolase [Streptacidiphilus jiangxiensis]|uniref:Cytosine deaminase n=1 Tax=Streptacidiphilus jiangxiensis TaxID=235985 RepID=A0A1H7XBV8_STRJI|nr:amidohydrolase [Streptacidiphilus jiangxiensis]SEM31163.1 cytosine deaminase [Streptacidiphilus jiangxiensis]
MSHDILFTGVRPFGQARRDLLVRDGRLVEGVPPAGAEVVDASGLLALPSPVDAHIHPDKTTWGDRWLSREPAADLAALIGYDVTTRAAMAPVAQRAGALMDRAVARGTRAWRAHVDVAPAYGLANLQGVREAAAARAELLTVQTVAFPQLGVLSRPGTTELLAQALDEGADVLGGLDPVGVDADRDGQLDLLFALAESRGKPLDIHLHDGGAEGLDQVTEIAGRTRALGMQGRVTVSHAFCLAECAPDALGRIAEVLAESGVAVTTCALGADPVVPFPQLTAAGVRVALGSDGVRDPWTPFGDGDMISRAHLLAYRTDARTDADLEACYRLAAEGGAALLGLEPSTLLPGAPADFVLLAADGFPQAVVDRPVPAFSVRAGRIVARDGALL